MNKNIIFTVTIWLCVFVNVAGAEAVFLEWDTKTAGAFDVVNLSAYDNDCGKYNPCGWWSEGATINDGQSIRFNGGTWATYQWKVNVTGQDNNYCTVYCRDFSWKTGTWSWGSIYVHISYINGTHYDTIKLHNYDIENSIHQWWYTLNDSYYNDTGTEWYGYTGNTPPGEDYTIAITLRGGYSSAYEYGWVKTTMGAISFDGYLGDSDFGMMTLTLNDDCANPLVNATTHVYKDMVELFITDDNPIYFAPKVYGCNEGDILRVITDTHNYAVENLVYVEGDTIKNLFHHSVNWNLHTYVYDEDNHLPLNNVKVSHFQTCRINGYEPNTHGFTNVYGLVSTSQLSNQNFSIRCEKEGYTTFEHEYESNFDAWNPVYRINIDMAPDGSGSGNTTLPDLPCQIGWADDTGILISDITDAENARLYYMGGNGSNILTWERRDTVNHVWVLLEQWNIGANDNGFKQFTPANWTEGETTRYRGTLTGYTCGCDASTDLTVTDSLDPQTVVNLTAGCFFRHGIGGTFMNPSSPIHILSYASSNNTTLVDIRLDLYNESVLVDTITYDFFDYYDGSEFINLQWEPNYQYAAGFNYSVYMYCVCEDVLVDIDTCYTNATGDNPFDTGNTLTVKIYDHNSLPLQYSTVYIESWGSVDTGATNEVTFTGLDDDTYEYRAIKSGYLDRGFGSVTLTADATVSYILDKIDTEHTIRDVRMADDDIKAMLCPIVFFILILLLIGVLIDAVN